MFANSKQLMLVGLLAAVPSTVFAQAATPSEDTPAPAESGTMPSGSETQQVAPDATAPESTTTGETAPATPPAGEGMPEATAPDAIAPDAIAPGAIAPETEATETEVPTKPVEGQIVMQSENTILANDLIGRRVYSGTDETVGDINDLIVNLDGSVEGVVIGVGGFLGMGEKKVAVEMSAITVSTEPDTGNVRLVLSSTREDLEAALEFKPVDQQKNDAAADQVQQPMDSSVAPAPAQ